MGSQTSHRKSAIQALYLWACRRLYNELAWAYDGVSWAVSAGHWAGWRELALRHLPPAGRVLEIGFGTGELLLALAAAGRDVYGVEPSPAMQRVVSRKLKARRVVQQRPDPDLRGFKNLEGLGPRVSGPWPPARLRAFAQALPFPDGCFAGVVATFPAEYIFDQRTASEVARVLASPIPQPPTHTPNPPTVVPRAIIGPFAISLTDSRLARLLPFFYGAPPALFLERWQGVLREAGLQSRIVEERSGKSAAWLLVADKGM